MSLPALQVAGISTHASLCATEGPPPYSKLGYNSLEIALYREEHLGEHGLNNNVYAYLVFLQVNFLQTTKEITKLSPPFDTIISLDWLATPLFMLLLYKQKFMN